VVHISDVHFWRIPLDPRLWTGKRLLGLANLIVRRARKFRREAIPELLKAIEEDQPDHLVVSGDLSTTSLVAEFEDFSAAFAPWMDDPARMTVIPGNHDRYTRSTVRERLFEKHFGNLCHGGTFPFLKELAPGLALAGFDPCQPNPLSAKGRVHEAAVSKLEALLPDLRARGIRRLLFACHYPAEVPPEHRGHEKGHELLHPDQLLAALSPVSVPIFWLHGHIHYPWRYTSPRIPNLVYLNPGAPTLRRPHGFSLGRWVLDWDGENLEVQWKSLPSSAYELEGPD
jgi:3',5'-cyclic AMP phosphodiesterase CpdA